MCCSIAGKESTFHISWAIPKKQTICHIIDAYLFLQVSSGSELFRGLSFQLIILDSEHVSVSSATTSVNRPVNNLPLVPRGE